MPNQAGGCLIEQLGSEQSGTPSSRHILESQLHCELLPIYYNPLRIETVNLPNQVANFSNGKPHQSSTCLGTGTTLTEKLFLSKILQLAFSAA
jgi:hypothetical protein